MQKTKTKKSYIKNNLKYTLPELHLSFDKHLEIIKGYVVLSKNGKEGVSYKNFKSLVDVSPTNISGNNEFFKEIGLIKEIDGKHGVYVPTEKANELYNALKWNKETEIKATIRELIANSWFWNLTEQLLELKGRVSRAELKEKLGFESNADPKKHNVPLNTLIDYLLKSGLTLEEDGELLLAPELQPQKGNPKENKVSSSSQPPLHKMIITQPTPTTNQFSPQSQVTPVVIGIMLNSEMAEDQIRRIIRIVLSEINKPLGEHSE